MNTMLLVPGDFTMLWTACPVHRIGTFHIVQDSNRTKVQQVVQTPGPERQGRDPRTLPAPLHQLPTAPTSSTPPELCPAGGSIKIICYGFYEQR